MNYYDLTWPLEAARNFQREDLPFFTEAASNIVLDFHGNPSLARLNVLSDGNHHMALEESLSVFLRENPAARNVFYATTPPRILLEIIDKKALQIGNLEISIEPHVFIGPPSVLEGLRESGKVSRVRPFMQSRGLALLINKGYMNSRTLREKPRAAPTASAQTNARKKPSASRARLNCTFLKRSLLMLNLRAPEPSSGLTSG